MRLQCAPKASPAKTAAGASKGSVAKAHARATIAVRALIRIRKMGRGTPLLCCRASGQYLSQQEGYGQAVPRQSSWHGCTQPARVQRCTDTLGWLIARQRFADMQCYMQVKNRNLHVDRVHWERAHPSSRRAAQLLTENTDTYTAGVPLPPSALTSCAMLLRNTRPVPQPAAK